MKQYITFIISYILVLILSQYIFYDHFNTYHTDHFYYLEKVNEFKNQYNFFEILIKLISFSPNINLPLIFFYTLVFKLVDSEVTIIILNTFFTLLILIKINKILLEFGIKKIILIEFLILTSFLTYLNIGINKEVITILILLYIFHEVLKISQNQINSITLSKLFFFIFFYSLIKPLHTIFLITLLFFYLIYSYISHKKIIIWYVIFIFIILVLILANLINFQYSDNIPYFNFLNSYQYININRTNFFNIGLTHPTLAYLNRSDEVYLFQGFIFSLNNISIIFKGILSSIIFPSIDDVIFAISNNSRFILFVLFDSLLIKIGICYSIYCLIKNKYFMSNLIILILMIIFTLIIASNVPNDGITYRYLYPYKFLFIFIGYSQLKLLMKKLW